MANEITIRTNMDGIVSYNVKNGQAERLNPFEFRAGIHSARGEKINRDRGLAGGLAGRSVPG